MHLKKVIARILAIFRDQFGPDMEHCDIIQDIMSIIPDGVEFTFNIENAHETLHAVGEVCVYNFVTERLGIADFVESLGKQLVDFIRQFHKEYCPDMPLKEAAHIAIVLFILGYIESEHLRKRFSIGKYLLANVFRPAT